MANIKHFSLAISIIAIGILIFIIHTNGSEVPEAEENPDSIVSSVRNINGVYAGSDACGQCHYSQYRSWNGTIHARMIVNKSVAENHSIPLPDGVGWNNISFVLGQKWRILYIDSSGYIVTSNGYGPGNNQWDVANQKWTSYNAGLPMNYSCGECHTTGYSTDGHQDDLPGISGTWIENGIGCEACHGPGSAHVFLPSKTNIIKDGSSALCSGCHKRDGGSTATYEEADGTKHLQFNDFSNSSHKKSNIDCISCHNPHDTSMEMYSSYGSFSDVEPAKVEFLKLGGGYETVLDSNELCGKCHTTMDSTSSHGDKNVKATCIDCHMSPASFSSGGWDLRSHSFKVVGRMQYDTDHGINKTDFPFLTCEGASCHDSGLPNFIEWSVSAHANTNHGYNANTYCSHCMSPFQYDPKSTAEFNEAVPDSEWTGINCNVCHDLHSSPSSLAFFNGTGREAEVSNPAELCGNCHSGRHDTFGDWEKSAHAKIEHQTNEKQFCPHCKTSPDTKSDMEMRSDEHFRSGKWNGITCNICHNSHSLKLQLYNGYNYEPPVQNPSELCGRCHSDEDGEYAGWQYSSHARTLHPGSNNNTYCARCHSPFQSDAESTQGFNKLISGEEWMGVTCSVCHDSHSLELSFWNSTSVEAETDPSELCINCHGEIHSHESDSVTKNIGDQWRNSGHGNTDHVTNRNTYCARCMSPAQTDFEATYDDNTVIAEDDWNGIGCSICHEPHSLELAFFNGSGYQRGLDSNDLCGSCHTMGDAGAGDNPRHTQLEMRHGLGGIGIEDEPFKAGIMCDDCHGHEKNHTFEATLEACISCHTYLTTYDAGKQLNEWKTDIDYLLEKTELNLSFADTARTSAVENNTWNKSMEKNYNRGIFNYQFVLADSSSGAHNIKYSKKLLNDANNKLVEVVDQTGMLPPIWISPGSDSDNVLVDTVITVKFRNQILFNEHGSRSYITLDNGVTGSVSYDRKTFTLTFTPYSYLANSTQYTVTLSSGILYSDQTRVFNKDFIWSFSTRAGTVDFTIGPILNQDQVPLSGVRVTLVINNSKFYGITDDLGFAFIQVPYFEFYPAIHTVILERKGYEKITFEGVFSEGGTYAPIGNKIPSMQEKSDSEHDRNILLLIFFFFLIIVIISLSMGLRRRRKKRSLITHVPTDDTSDILFNKSYRCPKCGKTVLPEELKCAGCGLEFDDGTDSEDNTDHVNQEESKLKAS